jgi:signal transduction histidine kinase
MRAELPADMPLLDSLFDFIPSGLMLLEVDRAANQGERILRLNARALDLLGLDPDVRPVSLDHHLPIYLSPLVKLLKTASSDVQRGELILHLPTRDEESTLGYNLKRISAQNSKMFILFVFTDISQVRKDQLAVEKIRDELHQSKKLASLGTLVAGVAHELNNPLTGISMSASLLRINLERLNNNMQVISSSSTFSQEVQDAITRALSELDKIDRAGEKAGTLVSDLLLYSKPSHMALVPMALDQLIRETIQALKGHPQFSRMTIDVQGTTDDWVACDRLKMEQVFYNLLKNSSDATQAEGRIRLFYSHQKDELGRQFTCIHVQDNGPGIDKTIINRIFDPFFTTKGHAGIGLGLSISYRTIEQHGGRLSVEDSDGGADYPGAHHVIMLPVYHPGDAQSDLPLRSFLPELL